MSSGSDWTEDERRQLALALEQNVAAVLAALGPTSADDARAGAPLAVLLAACTASDAIEDATSFAVAQARAAGHTWHEIGEVLAITRQAAQQRFGDRAAAPDSSGRTALARRATKVVEQIARGEWTAATADWNPVMRSELSVEKVERAWQHLTTSAGVLQAVGRATIKHRGPYRIAEVPLLFEHGPMRAQVTFDHDGIVSGLFLLLPEEPDERSSADA